MQSSRFVLNTSLRTESDGCMDWYLTVMPRGRSVNQVFGLEAEDRDDRILERLWVEIPLRRDAARFYQFLPGCPVELDGAVPDIPTGMMQLGALPRRLLRLPFRQQVYLGNDDTGFAVFFESDENWQPADENGAIECCVGEDSVILRLRLLDSEPVTWRDKGPSNGMDLFPLTFRIGMQATPVKPFPANPYPERNLHIDCFKKIPQDYEDFLMHPLTGEDTEIVMDRIKRLGVTTLYIHEKWNDIQNSPELTRSSADRLRLIVREAHARGIRVIPYFGYEFSTLSPIWGSRHAAYVNTSDRGHWYRRPWQRDVMVCYASGWQDYFVENLEKLMDRFGFDGVYLDTIMCITACSNQLHGCGYRDAAGRLRPTYPIWATRRLMQRVYAAVTARGGTVCSHSYASFPVPALAYADMLWEGESIQTPMLTGAVDTVPEAYLRAMFSGRSLGLPVYMLCYSNPPVWTFHEAASNAFPLGIIPKPVDTGAPLEEMHRLWQALGAFPVSDASWNPYFSNGACTSDPNIKVSWFDAGDSVLILAANMVRRTAQDVRITLPFALSSVQDAISGLPCAAEGCSLTLSFDGFDYAVLRAAKA